MPAAGSKGPGTIRPREAPPRSFPLRYRNYCAIISRALISSRQGGYMVHAARASTASATAPPSARHPLINGTAIRNARNSPENNPLHFSNQLKNACESRAGAIHPENLPAAEGPEVPVRRVRSASAICARFALHESPITTHQSRIFNRYPIIRYRRK